MDMTEAALKKALDQFLANIGANVRRELEKVLRNGFASGKLHNGESLTTAVTLSNQKVELEVTIFSTIEL